jgi:CNT family concentrative nucleoside transporter
MAHTQTHYHDPALDPSHEHTHEHLHHGHRISQDGRDQATYTIGTTNEPSIIPNPSPEDHLHYHEKSEKNKGDGINVDDVEKGEMGNISQVSTSSGEADPKNHRYSSFYRRYRIWFHLAIWIVATGWWTAGLGLHHDDMNWVVPFLLWLFITTRLVTLHVPISYITRPMYWTSNQTGSRVATAIPEKWRVPAAAALTVSVILIGAFVSEENADNTRENRAISLFGLVVLLFALWATSRNRKAVVWHTVIVGMLMQFVIALFVLRTSVGYDIFNFISGLARSLLGFAKDGVAFLTDPDTAQIGWFFLAVIPAIIFFVALVQMLYYFGTLQWCVGKFAVFFFWAMRISGAESVVAAATPFIGQGESAMLIKPFVAHLTMAELHQVMCSGFATIAGSVLVAYIGMGINPQALISSCVMSIPASLAMSKLRYPEEEDSLTAGKVVVPDDDEHKAANVLHAFANGAWLGLKIAGMIIATLLCIIALVALVNGILTWLGHYLNLTGEYELTIELILGYICYPIAFLLGVPRGPDLIKVARLIGMKVVTVYLPISLSSLILLTNCYAERIRGLLRPNHRPGVRPPLAS